MMESVAAPPIPRRESAVEAGRVAAPMPHAQVGSRAIWRDALLAWGAQRAFFALLTLLGDWLLHAGTAAGGGSARSIVAIWAQWDGLDYAGIASGGYTQPWQAAFSPLLPALAHVAALPLGGDTLLASLIVANLACLGAFVLIRALAERELGAAAARRALLTLAIFPTALFLAAAYTESLFLLLSAAAFLALRSHRWPLAGALIAFAALTRPVGILLLAAVAAEAWTSSPCLRRVVRNPRADLTSLHATPPYSAPAALNRSAPPSASETSAFLVPLFALAGYAAYIAARFGDPRGFVHAEGGGAWQRGAAVAARRGRRRRAAHRYRRAPLPRAGRPRAAGARPRAGRPHGATVAAAVYALHLGDAGADPAHPLAACTCGRR